MRFHNKNMFAVLLPIFFSVILLTAATSFGQAPISPSPMPKEDPAFPAPMPKEEPAKPADSARQQWWSSLRGTVERSEPAKQPDATPANPLAQQRALANQLKQVAEQQKSGWKELLRNMLDLAIHVLSGNSTNVFWGNSPEVLSKNKAEFLSGNKPKILSDNETPILSGNRCSLSILSNIKIEIHIQNSGNNNGSAPPLHANPERSVQTPTVQPTPAIEPIPGP